MAYNNEFVVDKETFDMVVNGIFGNSTRKIYLDSSSKQIRKDDILFRKVGNQLYFYKAKKDGTITIPNDEYCEKLQIGSGGSGISVEELKKKILNG